MSWTPLTHKKERFGYLLLLECEVVVESRYTHTQSAAAAEVRKGGSFIPAILKIPPLPPFPHLLSFPPKKENSR